jgi:hypothetical protein
VSKTLFRLLISRTKEKTLLHLNILYLWQFLILEMKLILVLTNNWKGKRPVEEPSRLEGRQVITGR